MPTTELRRGWSINGQYLRFADVLNWAEKNPPGDTGLGGDEAACYGYALVGYLLHRAAIDLCGPRGEVINQRTNTWSQDGSAADIEVTVGRPSGKDNPGWMSTRSYWLYWRKSEIEPAAEALALYRRYRKAERDLYTERVEVDHYARGGGPGIETDRFWIAYPPHIAGYAEDSYRISHAWGRGPTKTAALLAVIESNERG